jgi:prepilin-type processing-associated H-X9-DG protein
LVVIAIIGTLVGLLLPAVQAAREAARRNTCAANMTQLSKAIAIRETSTKDIPGYINTLGITGTNQLVRAPWLVTIFPQLEQAQLYEKWSSGVMDFNESFSPIEILVCPSNPPATQGEPVTAYVANTGWRNKARVNGIKGSQAPPTLENPANGVFFDRTRVADLPTSPAPNPNWSSTEDDRDTTGAPKNVMSFAYLQGKGDGTTKTLMVSESLGALYWGYRGTDYTGVKDQPYHFGFMWERPTVLTGSSADLKLRVNGSKDPPDYGTFTDMDAVYNKTGLVATDLFQRPGMPSSNHPGGVNVAFVGGQVQLLNDQIEPFVYAQLMTSNHKQSDLETDATASEPSDDAF